MAGCCWSFVASRLLLIAALVCTSTDGNEFTNDFAVEIDGDMTVADLVAQTHNLRVVRQVAYMDNVYHFIHDNVARRSRRSAEDIVSKLTQDPNVRRVEQQRVLLRDKRAVIHDKQVELPIRHFEDKSIYQRYMSGGDGISAKDFIPGSEEQTLADVGFNDPFFKDQWYLVNRGQTGGKVGYDINVLPVWRKGITGKGVVVTILDDGIDHTHPDLKLNYDIEASADLNDRSDTHNDPMPNTGDSSNSHGTRCAGEVAAEANNSNCCVGVAFNAKIGGIRMLDGAVTDLLEAEAITHKNQHIDIYSASWGPTDDGKTMEGPHRYCQQALKEGVTKGRGGKGSIYVWATGNGGSVGDDCSCDGYVSSIYTLSVGCISDQGLSTYFSEVCPSTLAVVFTGGSHRMPGDAEYKAPKIKVVTTDLHGDCTLEFQGTSSAAPLAAGCIALVLEANMNLTWRDVQNIVVETARIPNGEEDGWTVNGGGHHVNHRFGFGAMDCGRMVEAAQNWVRVQDQHICSVPHKGSPIDIYASQSIQSSLMVNKCSREPASTIDHLEHVEIRITIEHERRGDLKMVLVSPAGTRSNILKRRPLDDSSQGIDFTFMTVHHWGENPAGKWTLEVEDEPKTSQSSSGSSRSGRRGRLIRWSMTFYGVAGDRPNHRTPDKSTGKTQMTSDDAGKRSPEKEQARRVGTEEVKKLMEVEVASSEGVQIESMEERAQKSQSRVDRQRKVLLENGLDSADVDFLMSLFEAEEQEKLMSSRDTQPMEDDGYYARKSQQSQMESKWLKDKRNMEDGDEVERRVENEQRRTLERYKNQETLESIIEELSEIIDGN